MSRQLAEGSDATEAFRATVAALEGSVAIGAVDHRGTGPALPRAARAAARRSTSVSPRTRSSSRASPTDSSRRRPPISASTARRRSIPTRAAATRGQVVVIDAAACRRGRGHPAHRRTTARALPVTEGDFQHAQITTRDIDRGEYPHFLLKEISEAPDSFRKTLRGKITERRRPPARGARPRDALRRPAGAPARRRDPAGRSSSGRAPPRSRVRRSSLRSSRSSVSASSPTTCTPPSSPASSCATT